MQEAFLVAQTKHVIISLMTIFITISLFILGAALGSFSVAQVWRMRASQLKEDKENGGKINQSEWKKLKPLTQVKTSQDRSHCLSCGYQLKWFDLIPIFSWISLKGKCRKCKAKIGVAEFLAEIGLASLFVLSFLFYANGLNGYLDILQFIFWLVSLVLMLILFIYDAKWFLLPMNILITLLISSVGFYVTNILIKGITIGTFVDLLISSIILPGTYFALNLISKGKWVGSGDWIICMSLIFLTFGSPILALLILFFSNFLGIVVMVVNSILSGKSMKRGTKMPFGPLLISAAVPISLFSGHILGFFQFFV